MNLFMSLVLAICKLLKMRTNKEYFGSCIFYSFNANYTGNSTQTVLETSYLIVANCSKEEQHSSSGKGREIMSLCLLSSSLSCLAELFRSLNPKQSFSESQHGMQQLDIARRSTRAKKNASAAHYSRFSRDLPD